MTLSLQLGEVLPMGMKRLNSLRPRQNGRRFADDTFKLIFLNENVRISIKISLKFVPKGPINNNPALVQIMAWRRPGDKPLSESLLVRLPTHICVTRPQWVKGRFPPLDVNCRLWCKMNEPLQSEIWHVFARMKLCKSILKLNVNNCYM